MIIKRNIRLYVAISTDIIEADHAASVEDFPSMHKTLGSVTSTSTQTHAHTHSSVAVNPV